MPLPGGGPLCHPGFADRPAAEPETDGGSADRGELQRRDQRRWVNPRQEVGTKRTKGPEGGQPGEETSGQAGTGPARGWHLPSRMARMLVDVSLIPKTDLLPHPLEPRFVSLWLTRHTDRLRGSPCSTRRCRAVGGAVVQASRDAFPPRRPSSTIRTLSSAEYVLRVTRRMVRTAASALSSRPFCLPFR
jgi:hypothetical protein